MSTLDAKASFILTLVLRLESVLPIRTGYSVVEVELNAHFLLVTNLLLKNCKPNEANGHQNFISNILKSLVSLLAKINFESGTLTLIERGEKLLTSTLLLSRLLRATVLTNWNPNKEFIDDDELFLDIGTDFDLELGVARDNFELYAHPEPAAIELNVTSLLEILFLCLSPDINHLALSVIRRNSPKPASLDYEVSPNLPFLKQELKIMMLEMDSNFLTVIRFIAASNPSDYCQFVELKLFSWVRRGEHIPTSALQRYACLLMYVCCTPGNTDSYLKLVYGSISYVRSITWKKLFLHYHSLGLKTQCIYKPGFYSKVIYPGSLAEQNCKLIFDYITTAFENDSSNAVSISLYSWYVVSCPSDFNELLAKSKKLRHSFNKRVKFLNNILKESEAGLNLDCFESLISILLLGSLLPEAQDGVREFSIRHLDDTYRNLLKMRIKCVTSESLTQYRSLYVKFFIAAIIMNPNNYVPFFVGVFDHQLADSKVLFEDETKIQDFLDLLEVVKELSQQELFREVFEVLIDKISDPLSDIMFKTTKMLKLQDEGNQMTKGVRASSRKEEPLSNTEQESPLSSQLENLLRLIFDIYTASPKHFVRFNATSTEPDLIGQEILGAVEKLFNPIEQAIHHRSSDKGPALFNSACKLSMTLLRLSKRGFSPEQQCISTLISHEVIHSTCEMLGKISDLRFKEYFMFLESFLQERFRSFSEPAVDKYFSAEWTRASGEKVCIALDKLFLLSLCTHNVQFFSLAKLAIRAHTLELKANPQNQEFFKNSLVESFKKFLDDESVFTGFISLHKKFKVGLMEAEPTKGLYDAWLFIYQRWVEIIEDHDSLGDENYTFKHYTEFLVSTSGCFLDEKFSTASFADQESVQSIISSFYDKAVSLLKSSEMFVRVIVKDALSSESNSAVYGLIYEKLMANIYIYKDQQPVTEEGFLFVEETIAIFTSILSIKNDGAILLAALFPGVCEIFFAFVEQVQNPLDTIKLKLRLCKLTSVISADRERIGVAGAHKLRNMFARTAADWLEAATFSETEIYGRVETPSTLHSRSSDVEFLQVELATECSKCLEIQLQSLVLSIPDDTKESAYKQAKDLLFSSYFSLFYKIFQKGSSNNRSTLMMRSKYKIQTIMDNVLKAVSNMLKSNIDIGLQFALPLGFNENEKIRAIFLDIFATTLSARKLQQAEEEFPDESIKQLSDIYELYGAAAEVASPAEHNLLATSLHGLFGYTMRLDKLFVNLLEVEISNVTRPSDIFRGNSTLTRLMSIFAKEYGLPYLTVVLRPFVEEMADEMIIFEVEKSDNDEDADLFIEYLSKLVKRIVGSMPWVPDSFKFISMEIYNCVGKKFKDAALIAVGSFLFLRFFCPAIVSPESFFDLTTIHPKVKRSLMQLVKAIQYMANGLLSNLKWTSLSTKADKMEQLNLRVFNFMSEIAVREKIQEYPFHRITMKPYTSLRYIHKFFYTYFVSIRHKYMIDKEFSSHSSLHEKIIMWRKLDKTLAQLGNPKSYISLQGTRSFKSIDPQFNLGNSQFAEFMAKMSAKNIETSLETQVITKSVSADGTPTILVNFRHLRDVGYDVSTFVYLLLESLSQVWDNKFYCVLDLTEFFYMGVIGKNFTSLMKYYAPQLFFKNCKKIYCYNLPRASYLLIIHPLGALSAQENNTKVLYYYSEQDDKAVIDALRLSEFTSSQNQDAKIICNDCKFYDESSQELVDVTVRFGLLWLLICFDRIDYAEDYTVTTSIAPVETIAISDLVKCEISSNTGLENELTLFLNRFNYRVTLITPQRLEVLRFLYFAMLRSSRPNKKLGSPSEGLEVEAAQRFSIVSNLAFHGLLKKNDDIRSAASKLLKSFCFYFDLKFDNSSRYLSKLTFPVDTTEFVVTFSTNLARQFPSRTYIFLEAFLSNFEKLEEELKVSAILYVSPWVDNIHQNLSGEKNGVEKLATIIRQFCKLTTKNKIMLLLLNEAVWKKIFSDMRMTTILVDELVALIMVSKSEDRDTIISVFYPSVELCGEVVARLNERISKARKTDSEIVIQSKISEITILVKLCATLFFNSYVISSLYLLDVIMFCTLFIDRPDLDFGYDLQRLVINTIQSFAQKPNLTEPQLKLITDTITYFSGQRAKLLFGLTFKERTAHKEYNQNFDRAMSFELLCDYFNDFIALIGTADDKKYWVSRWASLAKDLAFGDSFFQTRAYTVVCTLSRAGISDSIGARIMEILTTLLFVTPDSIFEGSVSFYRLRKGFASDSMYSALLVWVASGIVFLEVHYCYQAMISSIADSFALMMADKSVRDSMFKIRPSLEPMATTFENRVGVKVRPEHYEFIFLFLLSKGLTTSQFRHTSVTMIRRVLASKMQKFSASESIPQCDYVLCYLLIYYLSVPDAAFQSFLQESNLGGAQMVQIGRDGIPKFLLDALWSSCEKLQNSVLLAAYIFSNDCEQIFKWKFIGLYEHMFKNLRPLALRLFHIVLPHLEDSLTNTTSISLINGITRLQMEVLKDRTYDAEKCKEEVEKILSVECMPRIDTVGRFLLMYDLNESMLRMAIIREMFYRNLSNTMDGQKLEKY